MKYFRYWTEQTFEIAIEGQVEKIKVLGGSNVSREDAIHRAADQATRIERRIAGRESVEDYEVPIKEYVAEVVDEKNVITVCRYGAKILNTTQYAFYDLDDFPLDLKDLFRRSVRKLPKKERIVYKFEERLAKHPNLGSDFRIYETAKGIRVIGKRYFDPNEKEFVSIMRTLYVDWIYVTMCRKQQCYRARLTPKPYRMKMRTIRVKSPLVCETPEYAEWAGEYDAKAEQFSVVRLIKTIGRDFSHEPVIQLHDRMCHADRNQKLV